MEELILARDIINSFKYDGFNLIYPFTTENINGYMSSTSLKNKSVLTVGSSLDQALNAYFYGAKNVDVFDINPFIKYYYNLKKAGIDALDYEEFIEFFCFKSYNCFFNNKKAFNTETFAILKDYLDEESKCFWSTLFDNYKPLKIRKKLFNKDEYNISVLKVIDSYLNEENYYKLKSSILGFSPTFYNYDLSEISNHLNNTYDYMFLSSIAQHIEFSYYSINDFKNSILSLIHYLNEGGTIYFAYLYDFDRNTSIKPYWDMIYHLDSVKRVFEGYKISLISFRGINGIMTNNNNFRDSVLVLKK